MDDRPVSDHKPSITVPSRAGEAEEMKADQKFFLKLVLIPIVLGFFYWAGLQDGRYQVASGKYQCVLTPTGSVWECWPAKNEDE